VPPMVLAQQGLPALGLIAAVVIGGALAAGGANTINCWIERDRDQLMKRTHNRPLPQGEIVPSHALVFGIVLNILAFVLLASVANVLAAALTLSATLFYVFVYTLWLKRTSSQNIVIGGAAGAVPVLVGWAAVTDSLSWTPVVMFAIIFVWTPPHFWALAVKYKDDYRAADVPMLPAVATFKRTAQEILLYSVILVGVSLLLAAVGHLGVVYIVSASVLGVVFVIMAVRLWARATPKAAMQLFSYSITYLTLLFVLMAVDIFTKH
jgi:heme o synthase